MDSRAYWQSREAEQRKYDIRDERAYQKQINEIYQSTLDQVQKEIDSFYAKYAKKEDITMAEAKKRADKLDMEAYARKAKKYVMEKDFSEQANAEMRLYNLTMKVNRLELLKANVGLEMVSGFDALQKYFVEVLTNRALSESKRQAGILGKSVFNNAKAAHAVVNASFQNATFSDRIWMHQDLLKNELNKLLQTGLVQGRGSRELARSLRKQFSVSVSNAERLMVTELTRVRTEAQRQSFERNGYENYEFIAEPTACPICRALDGKVFEVLKMLPSENAAPMHPHCRCSAAAYMDREAFDKWLNAQNNLSDSESEKNVKNIENPRNRDTIESKYGFRKIEGEHTREEDLAATNPNYSTKKREYTTNCQRCISTYEARRRGFDVEALPRILDGTDRLPYMSDKEKGWTSVYSGIQPVLCASNKTAGVKVKTEQIMSGFGDGARAIVRVQWQKKYGGGGHVFIAEQVDGKTIFIDPQTNQRNVGNYFMMVKTKETYVLRIDNLEFTDNIKKCCKNVE